MKFKAGYILVFSGILAGGCFTPEPPLLNSDNPTRAIPAIKEAADKNDHSAIPELIVRLDDADAAIRFAAISALKQMTGQTFDYRYYDEDYQRKDAVGKWHQWLAEHPQPAAANSR